MLNSLKTFFLLAMMTGALIFFGGYFYGQSGAIIALLVGLLANAFSYFFSDTIVLRTYRARVTTREDRPDLHGMVENLAKRAGLPMPRVAIVPDATPNAFATGRNPEHAVVAVTEGIMRVLSPHELEAVLAHELGHVKNRDILIGSLSAVLSKAIMFVSRMAFYVSPRDKSGRPTNPIAGILMMVLGPIAALLLQMAISRSREYMADDFAAEITGRPDRLADALRKISDHNKQAPMQRADSSTAHMMIVSPLSGASLGSLFSTHPPIQKRIDRLNRKAKINMA